MASGSGFHTGLSSSYLILTGLVLVVGGIFIAIALNIAGVILVLMGIAAFWMARRSTSRI